MGVATKVDEMCPEEDVIGDRDCAPRPRAPLPRALPPWALPLPLVRALGEACLPPDLLPLPLPPAGLGAVTESGRGTSRKASTTPMSQSMEGRGRKAEMRVSCTCASKYPSGSCTIGTN
jgi:hypothetical protein